MAGAVMGGEVQQAVLDLRLTPHALRIILDVARRGAGEHEIPVSHFRALLQAGEKVTARELKLAQDRKWIRRRPGGRDHDDAYTFTPAESAALIAQEQGVYPGRICGPKDTPAESAALNGDTPADSAGVSAHSPAESAGLSAAPFSHTSSSVHPPSGARAQVPGAAPAGEPPAAELEQLRTYLGDHAGAVDRFMAAAAHPRIWAGAVYGAFGPTGSRQWAWRGVPEEERPAILANALDDFAQEKTPYNNRHFEGFVVNEARHWKRRQQDDPDSAGPDGDAGAEAESEYSHLGG